MVTAAEMTKKFEEACKKAWIPIAENTEDDRFYDENWLEVWAKVYFTGRRKDIKQNNNMFYKIKNWFRKDWKKSE